MNCNSIDVMRGNTKIRSNIQHCPNNCRRLFITKLLPHQPRPAVNKYRGSFSELFTWSATVSMTNLSFSFNCAITIEFVTLLLHISFSFQLCNHETIEAGCSFLKVDLIYRTSISILPTESFPCRIYYSCNIHPLLWLFYCFFILNQFFMRQIWMCHHVISSNWAQVVANINFLEIIPLLGIYDIWLI